VATVRDGEEGEKEKKEYEGERIEKEEMAADLFEPRQDRRGSILDTREPSVAAGFDPSLDPTIRRLFEQQAEIQAKLATLLPVRYTPSGRVELDMLRHKLRALETYAHSQSMSINLLFLPLVTRMHPHWLFGANENFC
jgi:hypothetical protein